LYLITPIRFLIFPRVLLKYNAKSPISSFLDIAILFVRSPSPSDISFRILATRVMGLAIDLPIKNATTRLASIKAAAIEKNRKAFFR